jgi:hypothetical protein
MVNGRLRIQCHDPTQANRRLEWGTQPFVARTGTESNSLSVLYDRRNLCHTRAQYEWEGCTTSPQRTRVSCCAGPDRGGISFSAQVRFGEPGAPVLFLSGSAMTQTPMELRFTASTAGHVSFSGSLRGQVAGDGYYVGDGQFGYYAFHHGGHCTVAGTVLEVEDLTGHLTGRTARNRWDVSRAL